MTQNYSKPRARERMNKNLCPECGTSADKHDGWGGPGCSLTDHDVATRIYAFEQEQAKISPLSFHLMVEHRLNVGELPWPTLDELIELHRRQPHHVHADELGLGQDIQP